ncbi:MAG: lipocalin family protein [Burkholderiaceae bacterium]|jgi:apolipoprotein D and lipocalin family protein|nr:lipocalin family protein [Burkholderiaceae bacterium]MDP4969490.1 lipocalin family protein [Burkholderiaceae bacterium]
MNILFTEIQRLSQQFARALFITLGTILLTMTLTGCSTAPPSGLTSVTPFEVNRYLGKWYEIARLDHSFERGLTDVSATYALKPDGSLEVINRGFNTKKNEWKSATGRALFTGSQNQGSLKVSFFGPFFGGYHVLALDQTGYQWALVAGPDRDYLWILARNKTLSSTIRDQLASQAKKMGFATDKLIWVEHTRTDN